VDRAAPGAAEASKTAAPEVAVAVPEVEAAVREVEAAVRAVEAAAVPPEKWAHSRAAVVAAALEAVWVSVVGAAPGSEAAEAEGPPAVLAAASPRLAASNPVASVGRSQSVLLSVVAQATGAVLRS
jgi:hypothetical protein